MRNPLDFTGLPLDRFLLSYAVAVAMAAATFAWRRKRQDAVKTAAAAGFKVLSLGSLIAVLMVTLGDSTGESTINWRLGSGIADQIDGGSVGSGLVNIAANALLFSPVAFFGVLGFRVSWIRTSALCAVASFGVESAQSLTGRSADVDDVLLNTAGALTGAVAATVALAILRYHRLSNKRGMGL